LRLSVRDTHHMDGDADDVARHGFCTQSAEKGIIAFFYLKRLSIL